MEKLVIGPKSCRFYVVEQDLSQTAVSTQRQGLLKKCSPLWGKKRREEWSEHIVGKFTRHRQTIEWKS